MFEDLQDAVDELTQSANEEADRVFKKSREASESSQGQGPLADEDATYLLASVRALMQKQLVFNSAMAALDQDPSYQKLNAELELELQSQDEPLESIKRGLLILSHSQQLREHFVQLLESYQKLEVTKKQQGEEQSKMQMEATDLLTQYKQAHETIQDLEPYKRLQQIASSGNFTEANLAELKMLAQNAKEDFQGAVRVFVRIRKPEKKINSAFENDGKLLKPKMCSDESNAKLCSTLLCKQHNVPASQVFFPDATTTDIFMHAQPESIEALCGRLAAGSMGNLVLFGYGYSGSGKTFTLLGANADPASGKHSLGLFQLAINKITLILENKDIQYYCEECYVSDAEEKHSLNQTRKQAYEYGVKDEQLKLNSKISAQILQYAPRSDLMNLLREVNDTRKKTFRVKKTPNNPESSRSHLVFGARFTANDLSQKELAVLDLAGLEDSNFIFEHMIREFPVDNQCNAEMNEKERNIYWQKGAAAVQKLQDNRIQRLEKERAEKELAQFTPRSRNFAGDDTPRKTPSYKTDLITTIMVAFKKELISHKKSPKTQNSPFPCKRFDLIREPEYYHSQQGSQLNLAIQEDRYKYIWQLIDEGFFINATLDDLTQYLKDMKKRPGFVDNGRKFGTTGFCNILDRFRAKNNFPAKFVMICTINAKKMNKERDNCATDIYKTFEFLKAMHEPDEQKEE
jgi:hypothetical protein